MVFLVSSVLVTVPSGDWVTVFSFDLTVPSLLTLLLSVLETGRSHPTGRNDKAKADVAAKKITLQFFILLLHSAFSILLTCLACLALLMGYVFTITFHRRPLARPVPRVQHDAAGPTDSNGDRCDRSLQPMCQQWLGADFWSRPSQRTWHRCRSIEVDEAVAFRAECTASQPRIRASCKLDNTGLGLASRNHPPDHFSSLASQNMLPMSQVLFGAKTDRGFYERGPERKPGRNRIHCVSLRRHELGGERACWRPQRGSPAVSCRLHLAARRASARAFYNLPANTSRPVCDTLTSASAGPPLKAAIK